MRTRADSDSVRSIVRRELVRFAVPGVVGIIVLGVASLVIAVAVARSQSLDEARLTASLLSRSVVQPHLTKDLLDGDAGAIESMDRAFDATVNGSDVVEARLFDAAGTVIYSDNPRLMGEQFDLSGYQPEFRTPPVDPQAIPTDLARPENRYLDPAAEYVEVDQALTGADGRTYLFQMQKLQHTVQDDARSIWLAFAPILIGSVVIVGGFLLLLAVRMARRLSTDLNTRQDLLQHAIDASDLERRRISADLHDGTVQRLAGLGYSLAGLSRHAGSAGHPDLAAALSDAAREARESVTDLRTLLVDIYPPGLADAGLSGTLQDRAAGLAPEISVEVDVADLPDLDPKLQTVIYRVAREALLNTAEHSGATRAAVVVAPTEDGAVLRVEDDGCGFAWEPDPGHLGLRISSDLAESVGGELVVSTRPGAGTSVELRVHDR